MNKESEKLLSRLGLSKEEIKNFNRVSKIKDKFDRPLKIADIKNIKDNQKLGYIYKDDIDDKPWEYSIGIDKIGITEGNSAWDINGYPFDMEESDIIDNLNNPDFELIDIENSDTYWSLYLIK